MHNAGGGDDEEADDDGDNSDVASVPAQPPGAIVVTIIIAVPRLRTGNRGHIENYYTYKQALKWDQWWCRSRVCRIFI